MTDDTAKLLAEIEKFLAPCPKCGRTRMAASWFGQQAALSSHLVGRLRNGGVTRPETAARIRAFMRDHK